MKANVQAGVKVSGVIDSSRSPAGQPLEIWPHQKTALKVPV